MREASVQQWIPAALQRIASIERTGNLLRLLKCHRTKKEQKCGKRALWSLALVAHRHQFSPGDILYFVIRVQGEVADKVADLTSTVFRENQLTGARRPKRVLHVTLCCLGTWGAKPADFWERIEMAMRWVVIHPFVAEFDYVMNFGRDGEDHAIVLVGNDGVIGFYLLFDGLRKGLRESGFALASSYTPHITIIYDRRSANEGYVPPIRWVVREIVLVCSLIGKSKHVPLKEWLLAG